MEPVKCENCGNVYDKAFQVVRGGETHSFDSFECAIRVMAPRCGHCQTPIIGHGVEENGAIFCCVNCASKHGPTQLKDRN